MKTIASVILVLSLITLATPIAKASSPSASGNYRFVLDDEFSTSQPVGSRKQNHSDSHTKQIPLPPAPPKQRMRQAR